MNNGLSTESIFHIEISVLLPLLAAEKVVKSAESMSEVITGVSTLRNNKPHTLTFVSQYTDNTIPTIAAAHDCLMLLNKDYMGKVENPHSVLVFCENPRYRYAQVLSWILSKQESTTVLFPNRFNASIHHEAIIGENTVIEPGAIIFGNVLIGQECTIMAGAIIRPNVQIGDRCIIRENSVLGGYGFGIEKDSAGNNIRLPHIGGVIIGNDVEVGAFSTVCSGSIDPTIIEDYAKIDDHTHIAHNVHIHRNATITAAAIIGGSSRVGENTWVGINSTVRDGISVGNNAFVGMGAVLCEDLPDSDRAVPMKSIPKSKQKK